MMQRLCRTLLFIPVAVCAVALTARAQEPIHCRPADAVFFEAERMDFEGAPWRTVEHQPGAYDRVPSGLKYVVGDASSGTATHELLLRKPGHYRLWARYLDRWERACPFEVTLIQGGQAAGSHRFNQVWLRATDQGKQKWGYWAYTFLWEPMEADLDSGPCTLTVKPAGGNAPGWHEVDCFVLTQDMAYEPKAEDFLTPLYAKVVMGGDDNRLPVLIHVWGSVGHHDISRRGLFAGAMNGYTLADRLQARDESPWVNIAPILQMAGDNMVQLDALVGYIVPAPSAEFSVLLSRTPSEEGLIRKFHRSGKGAGMWVLVDQTRPEEAKSGLDWSRISLKWARQLPRPKGRRPTQFPLITGAYLDLRYFPQDVIENELAVLKRLGFSGLDCCLVNASRLEEEGFVFLQTQRSIYHRARNMCLNDPDMDGIRRELQQEIDLFPHARTLKWVKLMDEIYSVDMEHLKTCPVCADKFKGYLRGLGLRPSHLVEGAGDSWEAIRPVVDPALSPKLYYYTILFRNQTEVDFFRAASGILKELRPDLRAIANCTMELTSLKNLLLRGTDIFALYRQNALTFGFIQDANAITPSQQVASYQMDFLRSACKYNGQSYGLYNIISRTAWDIGAKSFAEVGHGARMINFYCYGQYYCTSTDAKSTRQELYPVLSEFNHAVGAVDSDLMRASPLPSRVAMLYSHTTDIWDLIARRQIFGQEQMCLYLLLRHLNYPIDILTEDDVLEGRADGYQAIFVTGSHLKHGVLARLLDWTSRGGFLYVGAGAAEFNQFNEADPTLARLGLRRQPFVFREVPGHEDQLPLMQVLHTVPYGEQAMTVAGGFQKLEDSTAGEVLLRFADGTPCATQIGHDGGRILYVGFFPGLGYVREACIPMSRERQLLRSQGKPLITWNPQHYPAVYREAFGKLLEPMAWRPPVRVSNHQVEACVLAAPDAWVVTLANWAGSPQPVDVEVELPWQAAPPRSVLSPLKRVRVDGQTVSFSAEVGHGDFVVFKAAR